MNKNSEITFSWKDKNKPVLPEKVIEIPFCEKLLVKGDNLDILYSLKKEYTEKIKLIYIDPPFLTNKDFKTPEGVLAYSDKWKTEDEFLCFIHERLKLMRDLLTDDGSIYVHCDYRINSYLRLIMDEVFGKENFKNEIVWKRKGGNTSPDKTRLENSHDYLLNYSKSQNFKMNFLFTKEGSERYIREMFKYEDERGKFRISPLNAPQYRPTLVFDFMGYKPHPNGWSMTEEKLKKLHKENKLVFPKDKNKRVNRKQYLSDWEGYSINSIWDDISVISATSNERLSFPTQKPEALLERIIKASSNEGDLVADFFCGSGTTGAVAEKLGRKWLMTDISDVSIKTTKKRLEKLTTEFEFLEC